MLKIRKKELKEKSTQELTQDAEFIHLHFSFMQYIAVLSGLSTNEEYLNNTKVLKYAYNSIKKGEYHKAQKLYREFAQYVRTDKKMISVQKDAEKSAENPAENIASDEYPLNYADDAEKLIQRIGELENVKHE